MTVTFEVSYYMEAIEHSFVDPDDCAAQPTGCIK